MNEQKYYGICNCDLCRGLMQPESTTVVENCGCDCNKESPEPCQGVSDNEEYKNHPDRRRCGSYTRWRNKRISKSKRKMIKKSRKRNRKK